MSRGDLELVLKERGSPLRLLLVLTLIAYVTSSVPTADGRPNPAERLSCENGIVYVGAGVGRLVAVDVARRKVLWTLHDSNLEAFLDPVLLNENVIFLASTRDGSELMSLGRTTGKLRWRQRFMEVASPSSPALCDGRLLLNDYRRGQEIAVDPITGHQVWSSDRIPFRLAHPPGVDGKHAWFVARVPNENTASKLLQLDCSDGGVRQSITLTVPVENVSYHPIVLYDGNALLSGDRMETQPGSIILLNLERREVLWRALFYHRMDYAPVIRYGKLIGSVWSVDLATGKQLFDYSPVPGETATFCIWKDLLVYQRDERTIVALDVRTVREVWRRSLPSPVRSNLTACADVICAKVAGQRLAVLRGSDGTVSCYIPLSEPRRAGQSVRQQSHDGRN
jgi:outer membrane protein assembly factor BamB